MALWAIKGHLGQTLCLLDAWVIDENSQPFFNRPSECTPAGAVERRSGGWVALSGCTCEGLGAPKAQFHGLVKSFGKYYVLRTFDGDNDSCRRTQQWLFWTYWCHHDVLKIRNILPTMISVWKFKPILKPSLAINSILYMRHFRYIDIFICLKLFLAIGVS